MAIFGELVSAFKIDNLKTVTIGCTTSSSICTLNNSSLIIDESVEILHICLFASPFHRFVYFLMKWFFFSGYCYAVFNTDNNHTVVQTYNSTIYNICDDSNALDNDTFQWASPDPSASTVHPVTVAVPLVKVGPTYFFSSDYDGEQCENGQRFSINVTHGQGLPPSLRTPAPGAPGPVSQQSGDDTVPDTLVPANFDHPKDINDDDSGDDDDGGKKKKSNATILQRSRWGLSKSLILLGYFILSW